MNMRVRVMRRKRKEKRSSKMILDIMSRLKSWMERESRFN